MNDDQLRRRLAEIAEDSDRVQITHHARQRMRQRRITPAQVLEVLRRGRIAEPAHPNILGNWQCTLERSVAGDLVKVAVALIQRDDESAVVITVIK